MKIPGLFNKRNKYGNRKVVIGGEKFDSKKEGLRHLVLVDKQRHGEIRDLKRQPRFPLIVNEQLVCTYVPDWLYTENGRHVAEDAKGYETDEFKIKWKLARALYPDIEWRLS